MPQRGDFLSRMAFRSDFWRGVAAGHSGGIYPVGHKRWATRPCCDKAATA